MLTCYRMTGTLTDLKAITDHDVINAKYIEI